MNNSQKHLLSAAIALAMAGSISATDITNLQAGKLAEAGIEPTETSLTIAGSMNAADFSYILDNLNELESLDIAHVTIEAYAGNALPYTGVKTSPANTLPDYALTGLTRLKTIVLPESLQAIGKGSLSGSGITALTVPAGVETIGDYAAMRCESLEQITVDNKVKEFGTRAFAYCPKLTTVNIASTGAVISEGLFEACGGLSEVSLIDLANCTEIGPWAFAECKGIETLVLPASTASVGQGALYGTSKISALVLPEDLNCLGDNAMSAMSSLKTINAINVGRIPELGNNVWASINQNNVTLVTPNNMVDAYSATPQWQDFNILSEDDWKDETKAITMPVAYPAMRATYAGGVLTIKADEGKLGRVAVFNAAGQRVFAAKGEAVLTVNVNGWPTGVYLVVSELGAAKIAF